MHWNGYAGIVGGVGGAFGCEGAFLLQELQLLRKIFMSVVIPGQKTDVSARDVIWVTPW